MPADFGGLLGRAKAAGMGASTPAMKPIPEVPEVEEVVEEDPMVERMQPIAEDCIAAIKSGDSAALADALIAAYRASASGPSESEE
jgi:hypothetical protein